MAIVIIGLVLLIGSFVWFYFANKKFVQTYPFYKGKFLWSLLYFPVNFMIYFLCYIIIAYIGFRDDVVRFSGFFIPLVIFGIGLWILIVNTRSLFSKLYNWTSDSFLICTHKFRLILIVAFASIMLNLIFDYQNKVAEFGDFGTGLGTSTLLTTVLIILICGAIWICGNNRLKWLNSKLSKETRSETTKDVKASKENQSSFEQLKAAKQLLDEGILSDEEFQKIKMDILTKGL